MSSADTAAVVSGFESATPLLDETAGAERVIASSGVGRIGEEKGFGG
jgi:hypothetical protein